MFKRRSGFTLIELLVVIAIIAILAAILFPVFAQARESARKTQCLSNLKQIGLAVMQYTQDYDETYPLANFQVAGQPDNTSWQYLVDPYVKANFPSVIAQSNNEKKSVYVCPNYSKTGDGTTSNRPSSSYAANDAVMVAWDRNRPTAQWRAVVSIAAIQYPAQMVMLAPHRGNCVWTIGDDQNGGNTGTPAGCNRGYVVARMRHSDGANFLLADGHAKWYKAPTPYDAESRGGVVRLRSLNPNAGAWFSEN